MKVGVKVCALSDQALSLSTCGSLATTRYTCFPEDLADARLRVCHTSGVDAELVSAALIVNVSRDDVTSVAIGTHLWRGAVNPNWCLSNCH